jgi:hypothetical protein
MAIIVDPKKILSRIAPKTKIKRLLTRNLTVNKAVLSFLSDADFISKTDIAKTALKVIRQYKDTARQNDETLKEVSGDKKLLVARVQNAIVQQVSNEIRDTYRGEAYRWLPSDANEPDPEHQLNYGKVFYVCEGEMPGDRYGCRCGMELLVPEKKLSLSR